MCSEINSKFLHSLDCSPCSAYVYYIIFTLEFLSSFSRRTAFSTLLVESMKLCFWRLVLVTQVVVLELFLFTRRLEESKVAFPWTSTVPASLFTVLVIIKSDYCQHV